MSSNPSNRSLLPYIVAVIVAVLPMLGLGAYSWYVASQAIEADVAAMNRSAAVGTAHFIEQDFNHWSHTLESFAALPRFSRHVRDGNVDGARLRLEILVETFPRLDRAFVTDKTGLLWTDYPVAPESLGKRFNERDWFKGVSENWQPYISGVYRRNAKPAVLLVAIAVPVHDPDTGEVTGALVGQVRLEELRNSLENLSLGEGGHVVVLDHYGRVAAHPGLDLQARVYDEYASETEVLGVDGLVEYDDPISGEPMIASLERSAVGPNTWLAIAQQPKAQARAPIVAMGWQILVADLMIVLIAGGFCLIIVSDRQKTRRLNRELDEANAHLAQEVATRKRAEEELQQANARLAQRVDKGEQDLADAEERLRHAQKMEAVGRLAGGVAHDFNNLLSVIIGYAEFAQGEAPEGSQLRADIAEIREAGERAAELTSQLLAFSRKQVLQPVVLDVNDVVARMDKMLQRLIGEDVDLVTRLKPGNGKTRADPGQLEQIIVNLAVNARDAMPKGGKLTVETGHADLNEDYVADHPGVTPGAYVFIAISDTGVGMDAETREKIFEPFYTTKEMGRGTGLGLSTVYGIVNQSGGAIWVYSEPGQGTTFKIYLPEVADEGAAKRTPAPTTDTRGSETILVVEDEPGVRRLVRQVLGKAGYSVLMAENGEQAVKLYDEHRNGIAMVLSDMVLPGMGGPAIAKALHERDPNLKVLFMSGYTDNAIVHHGVLDKGVNFIEKPLRPDALLAKIRQVLG